MRTVPEIITELKARAVEAKKEANHWAGLSDIYSCHEDGKKKTYLEVIELLERIPCD